MKTKGNLRIAKALVKVARMLIAFNRSELESQLKKKRSDLKEDALNEYLDCLEGMDAKEQKAALYWINKKRLILPEDLSKFNEAMSLIDKQHLDFQKFDSPEEVVNRDDKSTRRIKSQDAGFSPSSEPAFSNPYNVGNGITIYDVQDDYDGLRAVRRAVDATLGYDKNPWCLISRESGMGEDEELEGAEEHWDNYSAYPKRIAFKSGKPFAFCANDELTVLWWDLNDRPSEFLPYIGNDDPDFVSKYNLIPQVRGLLKSGTSKSVDEIVSLLDGFDEEGDDRLIIFLAQQHHLPRKIIEYVQKHGSTPAFEDLLEYCVDIPQELLLEWSKDHGDCISILYSSALDKKTFAELLKTVAFEDCFKFALSRRFDGISSVEVYENAAMNPDEKNRLALVEYLRDKSQMGDEIEGALEVLAKDSSQAVRDAVADAFPDFA